MKNLMRSIYTYTILLILAFAVSSCGGGGGGGEAAPAPAPTTSQGKFIDAAVEGMTYTSGSTTGLTGADGSFTYETGQTVSFTIGGILIGVVNGTAIVTPVQLISGASNQTDPYVVNIVQFLLTIDDDHDETNGIQITQAIRDAAAGLSLTFSSDTFDLDTNVMNVIVALTGASTGGLQGLVSESFAQNHLSDSLFSILAGKYSGTYSGTDTGNWTVTIATDGSVTGSGTTNFDNSSFSITGTVNTSGITNASAAGNAGTSSWAGNIKITTGTLIGSWSNSNGIDNGLFNGSKI